MSKLNIYACSGVAGSAPQRVAQNIEDAGWQRNETLRKYLGSSEEGGCAEYFLYIFIPQEDLAKYNSTIYRKRQQQLKTYEYVRELFVGHNYGTEQDMLKIIRQGIYQTFGADVEDVLNDIMLGKSEGVGVLDPVTISAIISAVVTIVLAVISGIIEYCKSVNIAKYTAPTMEEIADSAPAATDITGTAKKKGWLFGALAAGAIVVYKILKK